jgi:hypothetical protein
LDVCLASTRRDLVPLLVCVDVSGAVVRLDAASTAVSYHFARVRTSETLGLGVKEALAPLDLLPLAEELVLLELGLLPIFVSDLGEDAPMCLGSLVLVPLQLFLVLFDLLLNLVLSLLKKALLEPFLELHVTNLLLLLFFKAFSLRFLDFDQLFMMDVLLFTILPFKHGMGSLLHPNG